MKTPNKSFCVAPWVHAHLSANGARRLCCVADRIPKEYGKMSWADFKNSDYMKQVRKDMLAGKERPECKSCDVVNRAESTREELNRYYAKEIPEILKETQPDGTTDCSVRYVDYRHSLCNLKCRTCSPFSSSSYYFYMLKQNRETAMNLFGGVMSEYTKKFLPSFVDHYEKEFLNLIESEDINRVYLAGGEPLVDPKHFEVLDKLILKNKSVDLVCNTNLMTGPQKCKNWIEKLNQLSGKVTICISFDGCGEVGEYIRQGSKFEVIDKNIDLILQAKASHIEVILDMTLTSLNVFFIKQVAQYSLSKKITLLSKMMISGERYFPLLRVQKIPSPIKHEIIEGWKNYYSFLTSHEKQYLSTFNSTLELYASRDEYETVSVDCLSKLKTLEDMYPDAKKFFELLATDQISSQWLVDLKRIVN